MPEATSLTEGPITPELILASAVASRQLISVVARLHIPAPACRAPGSQPPRALPACDSPPPEPLHPVLVVAVVVGVVVPVAPGVVGLLVVAVVGPWFADAGVVGFGLGCISTREARSILNSASSTTSAPAAAAATCLVTGRQGLGQLRRHLIAPRSHRNIHPESAIDVRGRRILLVRTRLRRRHRNARQRHAVRCSHLAAERTVRCARPDLQSRIHTRRGRWSCGRDRSRSRSRSRRSCRMPRREQMLAPALLRQRLVLSPWLCCRKNRQPSPRPIPKPQTSPQIASSHSLAARARSQTIWICTVNCNQSLRSPSSRCASRQTHPFNSSLRLPSHGR